METDVINTSTTGAQMFMEDMVMLTSMTQPAIDQMYAIGIVAIAVPILAGISLFVFYKMRKK